MTENSPHHPHAPGQEVEVEERAMTWLVAPLPESVLPQGVSPLPPESVFDRLNAEPDVNLQTRITPSEKLQSLSADGSAFPEVGVFTMTEERARRLNEEVQVHVERDRRLVYGTPAASPENVQVLSSAAVPPLAGGASLAFTVRGSDGAPLPRATVSLTGSAWPTQGVTGPDGRVVISLNGETPESISAVYAKSEHGYWDRWLVRPKLVTDADNVITLTRLDQTVPGFPGNQMFGWGQKAMQLDHIPPTYRAHGIKVAVIDSGIATSHPDLADQVVGGLDVAGDGTNWSVDVIGHGTHCAGTIAGADTGTGIIGSATEAEIHACRIFPGGRISALLAALDYCIENNMDVVNLSLGTGEFSPLVAQKIAAGRSIGMACVAASGNNGSEKVLFPASLDTVLTVAAMGKVGEAPQDSSHAFQVFGEPTPEGYFAAKFSAYGPGVDLCAPGVAIISSVPPDGYAAQDGTSMAAPHVTSLAALTLAHHPDFLQEYAGRNEARVERLFQILRESCEPLGFGDPRRSGAGLPNAVRALGLESSTLLGGVTQGSVGGFTRTSATAAVDELGEELMRAGVA